jgi:hypothetical protein
MKSRYHPIALAALAALLFVGPAAVAASPAKLKLQYAGYLVDAPILDARLEVALGAGGGPYRMTMSTSLVGSLGDLFPFHMKAMSQGHDGAAGPRPASYNSEITVYDDLQTVTLTYGANGSVVLADQPPTEAGQQAVARGLLAGTVDPLSAALAIMEKVSQSGRCVGRFSIFDGARRYDLALAPAPEGLKPPRLPAAPAAEAFACDAAVDLVAGFPQYAIDAGMYPSSARFWIARDVIGPGPTLLRVEAESGLGKMRFDLRAILP